MVARARCVGFLKTGRDKPVPYDRVHIEHVLRHFRAGREETTNTRTPAFASAAEAVSEAVAALRIGDHYRFGYGCGYANARLEQMAERGDRNAQLCLGALLALAWGERTHNPTLALAWIRKAADNGLADAQFLLGLHLVEDSERRAGHTASVLGRVEGLEWIQRAADGGNAQAQMYIGRRATPQSVQWLRKAAAQGCAGASYLLGARLWQGQGVDKNATAAMSSFLDAAKRGHVDSMLMLAHGYFEGVGTVKDVAQAYAWYNVAAAQGDARAVEMRDLIEAALLPEQIAEAQRLSRSLNEMEFDACTVLLPEEALFASDATRGASGPKPGSNGTPTVGND